MNLNEIDTFSKKQNILLNWWDNPKYQHYDGIIADGSIRAGKTLSMSLSFIAWAMSNFNNKNFIIAGKSVGSLRRNIIIWLLEMLRQIGYTVEDLKTANRITITAKGKTNYFHLFGAKDERSQDFVQGMTAAGAYFDEVALMPQSFVNQATGRCSVEGSKLWFNCNPDSPSHWFKKDWLDKAEAKNLYHSHFTMDDNPSLSQKVKNTYRNRYVGVFFKRFILGLWVMAEGAIYDMIDDSLNYYDLLPDNPNGYSRYIAIDYGTTNPCVFSDFFDDGEIVWQENLYYYDSKESGRQKTDAEYANDFDVFVGDNYPDMVIVDPSAASFKAELRKRGYILKDADNEVLEGIRMTSTVLARRLLRINNKNQKAKDELMGYVWDDKKKITGKEEPVKVNDHYCDMLRYFIKTNYNKIFKWRI